jgi:hypothetical protein
MKMKLPLKHFKFEYRGKVEDMTPLLDAFHAYLRAHVANDLDIVISAMTVEAQEKLQDIEKVA